MKSYSRPHTRRTGASSAAVAGLAALACLLPATASAALARGSSPAAAATVTTLGPRIPDLDWTGCGSGFQCATAQVPLDYNSPRGATISLALIRLPASDPARRIGSLFLNPGGPGLSGVNLVATAGNQLFSPEVRARFDLVGFDPRGIGASTPLRCFDTGDQALAAQAPFPFPVTVSEQRTWERSNRVIAQACARRGGPILGHMGTANVARDLDLLRQAVGDTKLTYYGASYGTYLGATYANLFPGNIRALILDGVVDPVAWATGRGNQARTEPLWNREQSAEGAYATLLQFFRLCYQGGSNCPFSPGNPRLRYQALAERLRRQPVQLPDGHGGTTTFTYADLVATTLQALYSPQLYWQQLAVELQQLDTMTNPAAAATAVRTLRTELKPGVSAQQAYFNEVEGQPGVVCSDTPNPGDTAAWARAAAIADRQSPYFGRLITWQSSICQPWRPATRTAIPGPSLRGPATPY